MKILSNKLFLFFILIPFFKPVCFEYVTSLSFADTVFDIWRVVSIVIIFSLYIYERKLSFFNLCLIAYYAVMMLSTFLNSGNIWDLAVSCGTVLGVCMGVDIFSKTKPDVLLKNITGMFTVLSFINLATILLFPDGMYYNSGYENWFLGYDNVHIVTILPTITLLLFSSLYFYQKIKLSYLICVVLLSFSVYIRWSATSVVGITVFLLYLLFVHRYNRGIICNSAVYAAVIIISFFSIVILRIQDNFYFLIVNVLKKDLTFTGRTYIWDKVISLIRLSPIIGWGQESLSLKKMKIGVNHAHNIFLDVTYKCGVIGFILFIIMLAMCSFKLFKLRSHKAVMIMSVGIFCFMLMMQVEAYSYITPFYALLSISYNIEHFTGEKKEQNNDPYPKLC